MGPVLGPESIGFALGRELDIFGVWQRKVNCLNIRIPIRT